MPSGRSIGHRTAGKLVRSVPVVAISAQVNWLISQLPVHSFLGPASILKKVANLAGYLFRLPLVRTNWSVVALRFAVAVL